MAKATLITENRYVLTEVATDVALTVSVHEAQLILEMAKLLNSDEGDAGLGILDALRGLNLPATYTVDERTIHVHGRRPKEID